MAYRDTISNRDRGGAILAVLAIHAALIFALINLSGHDVAADVQATLKVFDVIPPSPPVPPPPPPSPSQRQKPKDREGGSAPNKKSEATPVTAPKPRVPPQIPNQIVVSETPRQGAAPTQGAAPVAGPGTGTGGSGNGTGTGNGNGGGGGGGGVAIPVRLVRGISGRDYPRSIMQNWPRGAAIFLRLRIEPNGRPSRCDVMRGFGNPAADQLTCSLILARGQFQPARDWRGVPLSAWFGYKQADTSR